MFPSWIQAQYPSPYSKHFHLFPAHYLNVCSHFVLFIQFSMFFLFVNENPINGCACSLQSFLYYRCCMMFVSDYFSYSAILTWCDLICYAVCEVTHQQMEKESVHTLRKLKDHPECHRNVSFQNECSLGCWRRVSIVRFHSIYLRQVFSSTQLLADRAYLIRRSAPLLSSLSISLSLKWLLL